jgi:DNA-binding protein HU-beta
MNKMQLVDLLATQIQTTKTQSELMLDAVLDIIKKAVAGGEEVKIVGFGTFERQQRQPRKGRNPQTGKTVDIPAAQVPRFRPGKEFKDLVK